MRLRKLLFGTAAFFFTFGLGAAPANAVVDVSSGELQGAASIVVPNSDSFGAIDGYSAFSFQSEESVTGGLAAHYKARLLADPWFDSELPELQLLVYSYSNQDAAESAFNALAGLASFKNGQKTVLASDSHTLFYESNFGGSGVDVFGTVNAEYLSLHKVERNGNLIFQSSVFRTNGEFNQGNLETYASAIEKTDSVETILDASINNMKLALGLLFPPTQAFFSSQSESSSVSLNDSFEIPTHGTIHLNVYVTDASAAVGTILDSSGASTPEEGDLYLYINSAGRLFAGIYAPGFDADCDQEAGWYRLETSSVLYPYEWNAIDLHYGVGGFSVSLNGAVEASCSVSQPRSAKTVYLGDYPGDAISESMIGQVDDVDMEYSLTTSGKYWDDALSEHLFLDLPDTDPDVPIFQYMKEKGVFVGSDGYLSPDENLNRAQMVKVLLKAFNREGNPASLAPFSDVPGDAWYRKYVGEAYAQGMVAGRDDGTFAPSEDINRAEFFTMLYRLKGSKRMSYDGSFLDVPVDSWYSLGAAYAKEHFVYEDLLFRPTGLVTRRKAAQILYSLLNE